MSFEWPIFLLTLLGLPVLVAGYVALTRRRRRRAVPYSSVALIRAAGPARSSWRRHVPLALVLAALASLAVAGARPEMRMDVPVAGSAVILALDVSGSMCATDVDPNRLTAAQAAVRDFVRDQPAGTRIGLVVFSGFAQVAVAPNTDRRALLQAIDSLTVGRGTAIGAALLKSVDVIAEINPNVDRADDGTSGSGQGGGTVGPGGQTPSQPRVPFAPETVVLLTDGANTTGIEPVEAARIAAARGVRVYPIGFGTANATRLVCTAAQLGGTGFDNRWPGRFGGGFGGGGRRNFLVADEGTLRRVATITGGKYFSAEGADELQDVLADLPGQVQQTKREVEVSVALAGLAVTLVLLSGFAAARWSAFPL